MLKFGWIGIEQQKKALEYLKEYEILLEDKKFFMEQSHQYDLLRNAGVYEKVEDIDGIYISKYSSVEEFLNTMDIDSEDEIDEEDDFSREIVSFIKENNVCYEITDGADRIKLVENYEDLESIAFDFLQDGRGIQTYTYKEAVQDLEENIKEDSVNELLTKFVLDFLQHKAL